MSIPTIDRRRRGFRVATAAAATGALALGLLAAGPAAQAVTPNVTPSDNPDLTQACGLDIVLVLDQSQSLAPLATDIKSAGAGLLAAFQDTNTRVGIVKFTKTAAVSVPLTYDTATTRAGVLGAAVASYTNGGKSNWQDAFTKAQSAFTAAGTRTGVQQLIVFVSDGQANTYTDGNGVLTTTTNGDVAAVDPAVTVANSFKATGGKVLSIGEMATPSQDSVQNMSAVSQLWLPGNTGNAQYYFPTATAGSDFLLHSTPFDAKTTDFVVNVPIDDLKTQLNKLATSTCQRSLSVTQLANSPSHPNTFTPAGAPFLTTSRYIPTWGVGVSTGSDSDHWTRPVGATGTSASQPSDAGGTSVFQWNADRTTVNVTTTLPLLYKFGGSVLCSVDDAAPVAVTGTASAFSPSVQQTVTFTVPNGITGTQAVACSVKSVWTGKLASFLTIRQTAKAVVYGGSAKIYGVLYNALPKRLAGQYVYIQSRPSWAPTAKWVTVGYAKTSSTGVYIATVKPLYNRLYRVYYRGSTTQYGGLSALALVRVVPKMTTSFSKSGARLTIAGSVLPRSTGQYVYLQKLKAGKWVVITRVALNRYGKFTFRFYKASSPTYYRVLKLSTVAYTAVASKRYYG